jgi:hypothetical protein
LAKYELLVIVESKVVIRVMRGKDAVAIQQVHRDPATGFPQLSPGPSTTDLPAGVFLLTSRHSFSWKVLLGNPVLALRSDEDEWPDPPPAQHSKLSFVNDTEWRQFLNRIAHQ